MLESVGFLLGEESLRGAVKGGGFGEGRRKGKGVQGCLFFFLLSLFSSFDSRKHRSHRKPPTSSSLHLPHSLSLFLPVPTLQRQCAKSS